MNDLLPTDFDVMQATPQPRVFTFTDTVMERSAQLFAMRVRELVHSHGNSVLLLSGGSNAIMYATALEHLDDIDCTGVTVGLVDERYGPPGHDDSNALALREAGVIDFFIDAGADFMPMLLDRKSLQDTAAAVAEFYEDALKEADAILYSVGIGGDGHTAGWLPRAKRADFEEVVFATQSVVSYKLSASETDNPHRQRLTTTLGFLSSMRERVEVLAYAAGESKDRALRDFIRTESLEDISQLPARGLYALDPQLTLLTDRDVA